MRCHHHARIVAAVEVADSCVAVLGWSRAAMKVRSGCSTGKTVVHLFLDSRRILLQGVVGSNCVIVERSLISLELVV